MTLSHYNYHSLVNSPGYVSEVNKLMDKFSISIS